MTRNRLLGIGQHLRGELLKARRTPALLLSVVAPYGLVLVFALVLKSEGSRILGRGTITPWGWLTTWVLLVWTTMVYPLVASLVAAQVAAVEHRARGFQRLFLLPVPRLQAYLAKQAIVLLLLGLSHLLLISGVLATGLLYGRLVPALGLGGPAPLGTLLTAGLLAYVASWLYVALITWVALVRHDFVLPVTLGFLATVSLLVLRALAADWLPYHPAAWPAAAIDGVARQALAPTWGALGLLGGLLFATVAGWSFVHRDV